MNSTLEEWEILQAVVQAGGFAAAAVQLNRSQSTISYAIRRLQEQLGVALFEMKGRKAQLTETGRVLLADAEPHLAGFRQLEQRARSLASGGISEIRLSVDSLFPQQRLFAALAAFTRQFPYTHPRIRLATFLSPDNEFAVHRAHFCIAGLPSREYFVTPVAEIVLVAVARRDHPLQAIARPLSRSDLARHTMVSIEGVAAQGGRHQPRSAAQRHVSVSSIEAAIEAVRSGLCFGWLPRYRMEAHLKNGELAPLRLPSGGTRNVHLHLVYRDLGSGERELAALAELLGVHREPELV